jgi:hypothetical protein
MNSNQKGIQPVASSQGEEMQNVIKAQKYSECSARTQYHKERGI